MREPLPLATIQDAVFDFLRARDDAVLHGAQAVNAYVDVKRMSEDVDVLSPRAKELAHDLRDHLADRFHIAVRIREVGDGRGYRIYQRAKPENRHLVDVRPVPALPPARRVEEILVLDPVELIAGKVVAFRARRGSPKSWTDRRDLAALLLTFPDLKSVHGAVHERLEAAGAAPEVLDSWKDLVAEEIREEPEDGEFA